MQSTGLLAVVLFMIVHIEQSAADDCIQVDTDCHGSDRNNGMKEFSSVEECIDWCKSDVKCKAIVYNSNNNKCFQKWAEGTPSDYAGASCVYMSCYAAKAVIHLGCWKDDLFRTMDTKLDDVTSVDECAAQVQAKGWTVFGVQYDHECYTAANAEETYNSLGESDVCKDGRGGLWANDVYKIPSIAVTDLGCWKDNLWRTMNTRLDNGKTVEECAGQVKARGWTTFGVQYGGECYSAEDADETYNGLGESDACKDGLGGLWANNVYEIPPPKVKDLGCWKDNLFRTMDTKLKNVKSVKECAGQVQAKGWTTFGVQYGRECYTAQDAADTYNSLGESDACKDGKGGLWANNVYQIQ